MIKNQLREKNREKIKPMTKKCVLDSYHNRQHKSNWPCHPIRSSSDIVRYN